MAGSACEADQDSSRAVVSAFGSSGPASLHEGTARSSYVKVENFRVRFKHTVPCLELVVCVQLQNFKVSNLNSVELCER